MKIILLNLFDAFFAGISAFIFFQTILGKSIQSFLTTPFLPYIL